MSEKLLKKDLLIFGCGLKRVKIVDLCEILLNFQGEVCGFGGVCDMC